MQTSQSHDPVKNNSKIIFLVLVLSWIIIGVGIWRVFFRETPQDIQPIDTPTETEQNTQRRYIGEKVLLSGELSKRSGFGLSTHVFIDSNENEFGARSDAVNLSEFEGEVKIKGEIIDFDKETPIISIQDIIRSGGNAIDTEIPEGNPNFWFSIEDGIGIDLSISQGYEVTQSEGEILLVESTNLSEPLLSIAPFECIVGNALQDCIDLKDKFTRFGNETFTNAQGVTFYNLTETNTRFIFDAPSRGYSLRSSTDNSIVSFADLIQIINTDTIDAFVDTNKDEYCRSLTSTMDTVQDVTSQLIKPGLLEVTAVGGSVEGNEVTCTMYVILGESNTVIQGTYDDSSIEQAYEQELIQAGETIGTETEQPTQPDQEQEDTNSVDTDTQDTENELPNAQEIEEQEEDLPEEADAPTPLAVEVGSVPKPDSLDGWLQYSSVRGFEMYFSRQGVSYVGEILETPTSLGMSDASCIYKVNVVSWQQADLVSSNPDLAVFECTGTQPSSSQAQGLDLQVAGQTDDAFYVVQRYTTNLGDIQVYVE